MAEFLSAGVYIQEVPSKETTVNGVSTSTFASVGWLQRGPVNKAIFISSPTQFEETFGKPWAKSDLPLAVTAYFQNGGTRGWFVRVVPTDATKATVNIPSGLWKIDAASEGTWGNNVRVDVVGNANYYNISTATYSKFDIIISEETTNGAGDFVQKEFFEAVDLVADSGIDGIVTVLNDENTGSRLIRFVKLAGGIPSAFTATPVAAESIGAGAGGATQTVNVTLASDPVAAFTLQIKDNGTVVAEDDGRGNIVQVGTSFTSITGTVNYETGALSVVFTPGPTTANPLTADYVQAGATSQTYDLTGAVDGTSVSRAQVSDASTLAGPQKGLWALNVVTDMCAIGLPDFLGNAQVHKDLIAYCANRKDFFAIIDCPKNSDAQAAYNYRRKTLATQSNYGAIYWPNVKVNDPLLGGRARVMSPVGHIAGRYAFTDNARNVGKAPAGVNDGQLSFIADLERPVSRADMDLVYPAGINPIWADPLVGVAVWGSRTLQQVGDYTQIGWRRLAQFLEKSFYNNSQDITFETLNDATFETVSLRFTGFLNDLTQQGYFASTIPSEAYKFKCDRENNTPATISARKLIADVKFSTQIPGEYIVLRFERSLSLLA